MSYNKEIAKIFAEKIMVKMEDALQLVMSIDATSNNRKFSLVKEIASLTSELLASDDINNEMMRIAKSSKVNGDNIKDKFDTFLMIRNVINHFSIFESWDEIYISKELLNWNNPRYSMIKKYFKKEKNMSYRIYLNRNGVWEEKKRIRIKVPKLEEDNTIYLKDIISIDDVIWTFSSIDYYLQYLGLSIEQRFMVSL